MTKGTCAVTGCDRLAVTRGWCSAHYQRVKKCGDPGGVEIKPPPVKHESCSVDGCDRKVVAWGYCSGHWNRWRKAGDPGPTEIRRKLPAPETCTIKGCEKVPKARGLCSTHWARWRKYGDPGGAALLRQPIGPCSMPGCDNRRASFGYCTTHYNRLRRYGNPEIVQYSGWLGDAVNYEGMHFRIYAQRGKACEYPCTHCFRVAVDWAYDHTDPKVRYDRTSGLPFSLEVNRYVPLCRSCHKRLDLVMAGRRRRL